MQKIDCFIPAANPRQVGPTVRHLQKFAPVNNIFLLVTAPDDYSALGCKTLAVENLNATDTVRKIAEAAQASYSLIYTKYTSLEMGYFALERMAALAQISEAGLLYADSFQLIDGQRSKKPLIDYQEGSLRNDFDFGSVLFYNTDILKQAAAAEKESYTYAGMYALRLAVSRRAPIVHVNEMLYTDVATDTRKSGEKLFDYVDPKNRAVQIDMEKACTDHLKAVGAYLKPVFRPIAFDQDKFEYEASVMIPVFNRERTIEDALRSALNQKTHFKYNVFVLNHHSSDRTVEIVSKYSDNPRLVFFTPERRDLFVGGLWNTALHHPKCGKFIVQLDSDDVYSSENSLQKMVDAFYEQNCAMVVGSYMMTDFNLQKLPPGIIDHREWTPENGRNNALRINGLGAPRAFYTPILRQINFPNTNYGEDYAVGLNFSRYYQIGRVYDVVYYCRRWDENSDAALDIVKENANNLYKDRIRTWELQARKQIVAKGQ